MERFLYTVNPRIPIRNLIPGEIINREKDLKLTLDEVKVCIKHGPVFRKFGNNPKQSIQVTLESCERLHQKDFVAYVDVASKFIPTVAPAVEPIKEEVKEVVVAKEPVVEDTVAEEPVAEEVSESVEEEIEEETVIEEAVEEKAAEETSESVVEEHKEVKKKYYNNNKYHKK